MHVCMEEIQRKSQIACRSVSEGLRGGKEMFVALYVLNILNYWFKKVQGRKAKALLCPESNGSRAVETVTHLTIPNTTSPQDPETSYQLPCKAYARTAQSKISPLA